MPASPASSTPSPTPARRPGAAARSSPKQASTCSGGVLADEAARVNEAWLYARAHRPALRHLEVRRQPGRADRRRGRLVALDHRRRRPPRRAPAARTSTTRSLVGVGTVLADDPALTVRELPDGADAQPPAAARRARPLRPHPDRRPRCSTTPPRRWSAPSKPADVLAELFDRGVRSVLLEGGPTVAGSFWAGGSRRQGRSATSRRSCSAAASWPALRGTGQRSMADALRLDDRRT